MPHLHLLGTGAAFTDPHRTTTMLAVRDADRTLLVDCGGDVVQRVLMAGLSLDSIHGIILTHEHPDHVSGFALFIEKLTLAGRTDPIDIYGIAPAVDQARRTFATYDTSRWALPEMRWHVFDHVEAAPVLDDTSWRITASPGVHSVPVVGLRIEAKRTGAVLAYSCDTERTAAMVRLAAGADLLVHEANGEMPGHSSTVDAAHVAAEAGAGSLVLVHLPPGTRDEDLVEAKAVFPDVRFGDELEHYAF